MVCVRNQRADRQVVIRTRVTVKAGEGERGVEQPDEPPQIPATLTVQRGFKPNPVVPAARGANLRRRDAGMT